MTLGVAILASTDAALLHGEARDALAVGAANEAVAAVAAACRGLGHSAHVVEVTLDATSFAQRLVALQPDVAFHLAESVGGEARHEASVASLVEWLGIPCTGSDAVALSLALKKPLARIVLERAGVPVPAGFVLEQADAAMPDGFRIGSGTRWIVKPSREDASHGIDVESVVATANDLRARAAWVIERYAQPALVERFVSGRELNVGILGSGSSLEVLPLAEIDFTHFPANETPLVTFAAKWDPASPEYRGTPSVPARPLDPRLEEQVRHVAASAYRALGIRGYGRVDLRIDEARGPLVLEVNPNPDISPDAGFARAAARNGMSYSDLVARILDEALTGSSR